MTRIDISWCANPADVVGEYNMTDKLCFTFEEAGRKLSVSRSMIYRLINAGELCSIHIAGRHLIPADALYTLAKGGSAHG